MLAMKPGLPLQVQIRPNLLSAEERSAKLAALQTRMTGTWNPETDAEDKQPAAFPPPMSITPTLPSAAGPVSKPVEMGVVSGASMTPAAGAMASKAPTVRTDGAGSTGVGAPGGAAAGAKPSAASTLKAKGSGPSRVVGSIRPLASKLPPPMKASSLTPAPPPPLDVKLPAPAAAKPVKQELAAAVSASETPAAAIDVPPPPPLPPTSLVLVTRKFPPPVVIPPVGVKPAAAVSSATLKAAVTKNAGVVGKLPALKVVAGKVSNVSAADKAAAPIKPISPKAAALPGKAGKGNTAAGDRPPASMQPSTSTPALSTAAGNLQTGVIATGAAVGSKGSGAADKASAPGRPPYVKPEAPPAMLEVPSLEAITTAVSQAGKGNAAVLGAVAFLPDLPQGFIAARSRSRLKTAGSGGSPAASAKNDPDAVSPRHPAGIAKMISHGKSTKAGSPKWGTSPKAASSAAAPSFAQGVSKPTPAAFTSIINRAPAIVEGHADASAAGGSEAAAAQVDLASGLQTDGSAAHTSGALYDTDAAPDPATAQQAAPRDGSQEPGLKVPASSNALVREPSAGGADTGANAFAKSAQPATTAIDADQLKTSSIVETSSSRTVPTPAADATTNAGLAGPVETDTDMTQTIAAADVAAPGLCVSRVMNGHEAQVHAVKPIEQAHSVKVHSPAEDLQNEPHGLSASVPMQLQASTTRAPSLHPAAAGGRLEDGKGTTSSSSIAGKRKPEQDAQPVGDVRDDRGRKRPRTDGARPALSAEHTSKDKRPHTDIAPSDDLTLDSTHIPPDPVRKSGFDVQPSAPPEGHHAAKHSGSIQSNSRIRQKPSGRQHSGPDSRPRQSGYDIQPSNPASNNVSLRVGGRTDLHSNLDVCGGHGSRSKGSQDGSQDIRRSAGDAGGRSSKIGARGRMQPGGDGRDARDAHHSFPAASGRSEQVDNDLPGSGRSLMQPLKVSCMHGLRSCLEIPGLQGLLPTELSMAGILHLAPPSTAS